MNDQRKDHIDPKRPPQRNCPKQLQTHNMPTYYVANTDCINKGRDLQPANKLKWRSGEVYSRGVCYHHYYL